MTDIAAAINEAVANAIPAPSQTEGATTPAPTRAKAPAAPKPAPENAPEAEDEAELADESAEEDAPEGETVELPDGYVAVPTVTEGLATEFVLRDADGEVEVPDLIVEYKANGRVRKDRLDQVVKMAQWGVYNQEREQRTQQIELAARQADEERTQVAQMLAEREAQIERLLTDEAFLEAVRDAYSAENSPERRAERAEEQIQTLRVAQQMEHIASEGMQFHDGEVAPALALIAQALPTVSTEELEDRLAFAMQAHAVRAPNGEPYVPASRYDAVRRFIVDDLAVWAQIQHARRSEPTTDPVRDQALAERDRARVEAQKAKRAVGQALKPVGRSGGISGKPTRSKAPATVDDALSSALDEVLSRI